MQEGAAGFQTPWLVVLSAPRECASVKRTPPPPCLFSLKHLFVRCLNLPFPRLHDTGQVQHDFLSQVALEIHTGL